MVQKNANTFEGYGTDFRGLPNKGLMHGHSAQNRETYPQRPMVGERYDLTESVTIAILAESVMLGDSDWTVILTEVWRDVTTPAGVEISWQIHEMRFTEEHNNWNGSWVVKRDIETRNVMMYSNRSDAALAFAMRMVAPYAG